MSTSQSVTAESPSSSNEYVYKPLALNDPDKHHIRVVHLFPAANVHDEIECGLISTSLRSNIRYEALSYVWGDPNDKKPIRVNGRVYHVTANLFDALQHLRRKDEARTLWIDAICINQKDGQEKGIQVALMGRIFKEAWRTVAWLGPEGTAKIALDFCETLEDIPSDPSHLSLDQARYWLENLRSTDVCQELFQNRTYWHRLWIVQELCLNPSTFFQLGDRQIAFRDFYRLYAIYSASQFVESIQDTVAGSTSVDRMQLYLPPLRALFLTLIADYRNIQDGTSLSDLLESFKHQSVTDPRDRVYGLLGLASQGWQDRITPDYTRSLRDVYISTAVQLVNTGGLAFLRLVEADEREITCEQLPSWVPDLATHETAHSHTWTYYWAKLANLENAKDLGRLSLIATSMMKEDGGILFIPGLSVGIVMELHSPQPYETAMAPIYFGYTRDPRRRDLQSSFREESIESIPANWGPCKMRIGDVIIYSPGLSTPLILRPYSDGFLFVGLCFLLDAPLKPRPNYLLEFDVEGPGFSDIMRGSLMKDIESVEQLETFKIY